MKMLRNTILVPLVLALSALVTIGNKPALAQNDLGMTVLLKIYRIEQVFDLMDQVVQGSDKASGPLPTAMIRGMLQGTAWIDDQRAMVLGVDTSGPELAATVLIPFLETNDQFKNSFNAEQGQNYYLIGLPPGKQVEITDENRQMLEMASSQPSQSLVSLEISLAQLIRQNKDRIAQQMLKLDTMSSSAQAGPGAMEPRNLKELLQGMIQLAEQVDKLTFALDVDARNLTGFFKARAVDQTELAAIFTSAAPSWRLADLNLKGHISFASRAFDAEGLLNLFTSFMAPVYNKSGMDFQALVSLVKAFTGEMAGSVSFADDRIEAETITVLKDKDNAPGFIENIYLPWLTDYMRSIQNLLEQQGIEPEEKLWVRTTDSRVRGLPVYGVEMRIPMMPMMGCANAAGQGRLKIMRYPMRIAVINDMLISAPDDARLAKLISKVKNARLSPAPAWVARYSLDTKAYLSYIASILPFQDQLPRVPTGLGRMVSEISADNGQLAGKTVIAVKDLKAIASFFRDMAQAAKSQISKTSPITGTSKTKTAKIAPTPAEMVEKGNLLATYGNYQAAVEYYRKAISKQPGLSVAYFNLGLAYGELDEYDQALKALDKAIELVPDKAVYYYGRARVLLMAGRQDQARQDFEKAASLGNEDAQRYLENQSEKENG